MIRPKKNASSARGSEQPLGQLQALLRMHPVIPALRSLSDISAAAAAPSRVVYLLAAALSTLDEYLHVLRLQDKEVS